MPKPFAIADPDIFFRSFPKLSKALKPSSPQAVAYICFSLAVGDTKRVWAPERFCVWLPKVTRSRAVSAFVELFEELGYEDSDETYERGVRKIAIYALNGYVKHAAVQPPDKKGKWHSKMGVNVNIMHTLRQLEGPEYGEVVRVMRERRPSPAKRVRATGSVKID
jgi:hypothetical protein